MSYTFSEISTNNQLEGFFKVVVVGDTITITLYKGTNYPQGDPRFRIDGVKLKNVTQTTEVPGMTLRNNS